MSDHLAISLITGKVDILELDGITTGAASYTTDFDSSDLVAGILTVIHNLGSKYVSVTIYDNNDILIYPDTITATDANTTTINFSSFGTIAGTWNVRIIL